jgi:acetolactate synthase regulatory subunit
MSQALHRLVYLSHNEMLGTREEVAAEVQRILAVSRRRNFSAGITGALMFNAGCFAQVLEGRLAAVSETFERIQRDPRHSDVAVLEFEAISARSFPDWSMAYVGHSDRSDALLATLAGLGSIDTAAFRASSVLESLEQIVRDEDALIAAS